MQSILELRPESDGNHFVIHVDNARLYIIWKFQMFYKINFLRMVLHSPYPGLDFIK
jgi:hypothetical protein